MELRWSGTPPAKPGLYLYMSDIEQTYRPLVVTHGNWQLGQNAQFLYTNNQRLASFGSGHWLGPLPEVERDGK